MTFAFIRWRLHLSDDVCIYQMTFAFISLQEGNTKGSGVLLLVVNTVTQTDQNTVAVFHPPAFVCFFISKHTPVQMKHVEPAVSLFLFLEQQLIPRGIQRKGSVCWVTSGKWWQYPKSTLDWRSGWRPTEQRWILGSLVSLAGSRSVWSVWGRTPLSVQGFFFYFCLTSVLWKNNKSLQRLEKHLYSICSEALFIYIIIFLGRCSSLTHRLAFVYQSSTSHTSSERSRLYHASETIVCALASPFLWAQRLLNRNHSGTEYFRKLLLTWNW